MEATDVRKVLETLVWVKGGPSWITKALAYREVGGEILNTTTGIARPNDSEEPMPGETEGSSPERHAVVDAHKATCDRLTTAPEDLVDLITYILNERH